MFRYTGTCIGMLLAIMYLLLNMYVTSREGHKVTISNLGYLYIQVSKNTTTGVIFL